MLLVELGKLMSGSGRERVYESDGYSQTASVV